MVTVILKVAEMTLLKYPTWGESFPKTINMLTMIMNEQQTMPYYLNDEIASKPYNRNWDNLLLIGLNFTAGSNQTSRPDHRGSQLYFHITRYVLKRRREDTFWGAKVKIEFRHLFSLQKRFSLCSSHKINANIDAFWWLTGLQWNNTRF